MFWERFIKLCNEHNTKPNPLAKSLNISSGAVTKWKSGAMPNDTTLYKIAEHFNVSIGYLKGEENPPSDSDSSREFVIYHRDGKTKRIKFTPEQLKIFQALVDSANSEDTDN